MYTSVTQINTRTEVYIGYYNSKTLGLVNKQNLVLGLTQENSIENSVQDSLPYILITHGLCSTTLAYPK